MDTFTGTVGAINLNDNSYASGEQFFMICIIPEPSSLALLGLSLLALAGNQRRRRRR